MGWMLHCFPQVLWSCLLLWGNTDESGFASESPMPSDLQRFSGFQNIAHKLSASAASLPSSTRAATVKLNPVRM